MSRVKLSAPVTPALTPAYLLYAITSVVGLLVTQGLIDNATEKVVTGVASIVIPAAFAVGHAVYAARTHAASIAVPQIDQTAAAKVQAEVAKIDFPGLAQQAVQAQDVNRLVREELGRIFAQQGTPSTGTPMPPIAPPAPSVSVPPVA